METRRPATSTMEASDIRYTYTAIRAFRRREDVTFHDRLVNVVLMMVLKLKLGATEVLLIKKTPTSTKK